MEKCQKPNIHLCNIILVIVETIFGSSGDFCLLYIYYLRKLVNIGKVKKKNLLCSLVDVIPVRFAEMRTNIAKKYTAEMKTTVLHRDASYARRKQV